MSEGIGRRGFLNGLAAIVAGTALNACSGLPSRTDCLAKAKECLASDDYVHAIRWLDDLLAQDPKNHDALGARGWSYFQLNQLNPAIDNFNEAIALQPGSADYRTKRGFSYTMRAMQGSTPLSDAQGALDDFRDALKIDDKFADAYAGRGFAYALLRNKQNAYDAFKKAKELISAGSKLRYLSNERVEQSYRQMKEELGIKDEFF